MNDEQTAITLEILKELGEEVTSHAEKMKALRNRLLQRARYFDTYAEMYLFVKKHTPSFQDFCLDMQEAAPIFFEAEKQKAENKFKD